MACSCSLVVAWPQSVGACFTCTVEAADKFRLDGQRLESAGLWALTHEVEPFPYLAMPHAEAMSGEADVNAWTDVARPKVLFCGEYCQDFSAL